MSENSDSSKIEERLRWAREQAGLSQGQIAKLMNLHRPTISEIEAGRRKVTSEDVKAFAEHYGVTVSWVMGESNTDNPLVELAARELSKLKKEDLDRFLRILKSMKDEGGSE